MPGRITSLEQWCVWSLTWERGVQWENETIVGGIISQQPCQPKWLLWCCEEGFYVRWGVCYSDLCLLQVLAWVLLQLYFVGQLLLSNIVNMYCNRFNLLIISDLYNSCLTTFLQPLILFSVCAHRIEQNIWCWEWNSYPENAAVYDRSPVIFLFWSSICTIIK